MKFTKFAAAAAALALCASALSAQNIDLNGSTAGTIGDNQSYFMDLTGWQNMDFQKAYAYLAIDSATKGNLSFACHAPGSNVLALSWVGNLWDNTTDNTFNAFYGFNDNMAIKGGFAFYDGTRSNITVTTYDPSLYFGMNVTDAFNFNVGFGVPFANASEGNKTISYSAPTIHAGLNFDLLSKGSCTGTIGAYYEGTYATTKLTTSVTALGITTTTEATTNTNTNTIGITWDMQYDFSDSVAYGLGVALPFVFTNSSYSSTTNGNSNNDASSSGGQKLYFKVNNGIRAKAGDLATIAIGIHTELPYLNFNGDNGSFSNSFYTGFAIAFTPDMALNANSTITPTNGVSMDDVWNTKFNISLSMRF